MDSILETAKLVDDAIEENAQDDLKAHAHAVSIQLDMLGIPHDLSKKQPKGMRVRINHNYWVSLHGHQNKIYQHVQQSQGLLSTAR